MGLTLQDISSGALPQVRLAELVERRRNQERAKSGPAKRIVVYTTNGTDTQALIARTKYKERGAFFIFLYFSDGAVQVCKELGIPLHILDSLDESELPSNRQVVLEDPLPLAR